MASCQSTAFQNAEEGLKLVKATSQFALNLYKEQAAVNTGNLFMSPMSISIAMGMTYLGARGKTMSQMKEGMFFGDVKEADLDQAFSDVRTTLNSPNDAYQLLVANKLFGEKSFSFEADFLASCDKFYGTELAKVDFINNGPETVARINGWVADHTNQKIKNILSAGDVDVLTRLILVNAIYFKGDWKNKFDTKMTTNEKFYLSARDKIKVPLMFIKKAVVGYGVNQTLQSQAVELPYVNEALSMFVILPDRKVTDIHKVEQCLTVYHLNNITESFGMRYREVNLWLPRFKIDEKMNLNDLLAKMGIVDMFNPNKADFTGMSKEGGLYCSKVLHQAWIEVNEQGSEAAAATAVILKERGLGSKPPPPFDFRADHPFLFFIRENATQSILFFGRLSKPEGNDVSLK